MTEQPKTEVKLTASQRIENLENAVMQAYQTMDGLTRDIMTIKDAMKLLGNKLDSVVKAMDRGEKVNDETVGKIMIENNVDELKQKVAELSAKGILVASEIVSDTSFLVGKETEDDGAVVNPRLQFALAALQPELREKIKGAKAGDVLNLQEGKLKFELLEVYEIVTPKAEEPVAPQPEAPVEVKTEEPVQA